MACPLPIPFVSRVIQIEPPPIPTFTKSAPQSARNLNPSASTTFPAPTFTLSPYLSLIHLIVNFCQSENPSDESIQSTSAPASTRAGTLVS